MKRTTSPWWVAACCALAASCAAERSARLGTDPDVSDMSAELLRLETEVPPPPERRSRPDDVAPPVAFAPREIPRALTATVCVRGVPDQALLGRETFRLSPQAVSSSGESGAEWWLARNPLSGNELSGAQTLPGERLVIHHTAGDLRLIGKEGLWDRCAALGGVQALPRGLRATSRAETRFGLEFQLWEAEDESSVLREVWWNEERALALRIVVRGAERSLVREIETLEWAVDAAALRHPSERHPEWACLDLSDWQDACGPTHAASHDPVDHGEAGAER